ncbi:MAG: hypothetical protein MUF45_02315 [Spirosomaceae bacterium]|jgi:hypothetical protein|nr:hypothetical protein [Spirosomataceae bacterium]
MKKTLLGLITVGFLFVLNTASVQAQSIEDLLNNAMSMHEKGDLKGLESALSLSSSKLESEAKESKGDFKDKLTSSLGGLKALIPLAGQGQVKKDGLQKVINTVRLLLGANRLSGMLGGGNLLGNVAGLKGNLGLMQLGMSALGGQSSNQLGSLISSAMGGIGQLERGGVAAKTAEPAVRKQLGGVLDFVKKAI